MLDKILSILKRDIKVTHFVLIMSALNFLFFHFPFFKFAFSNLDINSFNGILLTVSLLILVMVFNAFAFYLFLSISKYFGKFILVVTFLISSFAIYFVNTYNAIIDESMLNNVFNTKYSEASSFFSIKIIFYMLIFGVLPSIYIIKAKIINEKIKKRLIRLSLAFLFILALVLANGSNWLWIDKNATKLGGLVMPWSYTINSIRYMNHQHKRNKKEILLPDATIQNDKKSVVVLVIGESARSQNFSLYGYEKNTNPLLSQTPNLYHFDATSCATYTTAALKCILEHKYSKELYEILPNYLNRNNVHVVWRTTNWGEPPIHIEKFQKRDALLENYTGENGQYDEILISGLKEEIMATDKSKTLIVLSTSTSHGPSYNKRYPAEFEVFKPVCTSVELANCTHDELINAYDNTIVYTDYLLHSIIQTLKEMEDYESSMIFVSDHGESLGEKNLYMHGVPMSIAPREQFEIPFIVWVSENSKQLKPNKSVSQHHVFHSVMNFLSVESPIYDENMNIYQ